MGDAASPPDAQHPGQPCFGRGVCVLTGSFGEGRGAFYTPHNVADGVSYIALCWKKLTARSPWERRVLPAEGSGLDASKVAKFQPWTILPGYEWYIWIDAQCRLLANPVDLVNAVGGKDLGVIRKKHGCVYREGRICRRKGKADPEALQRGEEFYRSRGWPEEAGLFFGGCLVIHRTPATQLLGDIILERCRTIHYRDQVHLPPSISECNVAYHPFPSPSGIFREGA